MYQLLKPGDVVLGHGTKARYVVRRYIGGGGQGEVYEAERDGVPLAVKWYFMEMATPQQRATLESLVAMKAPDHRFLWPIEIVAKESGGVGFGYAMPLRDKRFRGIVELLKGTVQPSFATLTTAGINLVEAFRALHSSGRSYRDINEGGVFVDFTSGDVLVCDNDNVYIDGMGDAGVKGKMKWMAPEIVVGKANPSSDTDLYSLSVLLFYMFVVHHPLEGKRESDIRAFDHHASVKLYGEDPVFIYDPANDTNRPVKQFHKNAIVMWKNYPRFLHRSFEKSFTEGIRDPANGRVRLPDWRKCLVQLRDSIYHCTRCKAEVFFDAEQFAANGGAMAPCIECGKVSKTPLRMRCDKWPGTVVAEVGKKLYDHHLFQGKEWAFADPRAEFVDDGKSPSGIGVRNQSDERWTVLGADGVVVGEVTPGAVAPITNDCRIGMGQRQVTFRL
jgi:DNA-binding helix-hairpin-helix protein with protein kinase domain